MAPSLGAPGDGDAEQADGHHGDEERHPVPAAIGRGDGDAGRVSGRQDQEAAQRAAPKEEGRPEGGQKDYEDGQHALSFRCHSAKRSPIHCVYAGGSISTSSSWTSVQSMPMALWASGTVALPPPLPYTATYGPSRTTP